MSSSTSTSTSARHANLPVWRDANLLLLAVEQAVRRFGKTPSPPRYHKYALGTDLRRQAMTVCRCIVRAATAPNDVRERAVERLVLAVEDLKLSIQLAKELQAFASFAEFARLAELAVAVGKQSGGWRKSARARARPEVLHDAHKAGG
jgi:hypothetical protein